MSASDAAALATMTMAEHPLVAATRLRLQRRTLWAREVWAGRAGTAQPIAVHHDEVDRILCDPGLLVTHQADFYRGTCEITALTEAVGALDEQWTTDSRWQRLARCSQLRPDEQALLALAVAQHLEPQFGRVFAYLHDHLDLQYATPWLAAALDAPRRAPQPLPSDSPLVTLPLLLPAGGGPQQWSVLQGWVADPSLVAWLTGEVSALGSGAHLDAAGTFAKLPCLYREQLDTALSFLRSVGTGAAEVELVGPIGSGRSVLAGQIAEALGLGLLTVDEATFLRGARDDEAELQIRRVVRQAMLDGAIVYWREAREPSPLVRRSFATLQVGRFVGRVRPTTQFAQSVPGISVQLPPLSRSARVVLWHAVSEDSTPEQLEQWQLVPAEVLRLAKVAAAGGDAMRQAVRRPVDSDGLLVKMPLPYYPADLILPDPIARALADFEDQVRHRWGVYEDWRLLRLSSSGGGIVGLFAGPSGTGKTMAAQVIARNLGMDLYRLDASQVVDKYIGETEKRLRLVFDDCERANFILLIDECDALLGKRMTSKDAHDRYANLEINYLLQRLERFEGIAILSTNRRGDLDEAFLRRIRVIVDFLNPDREQRAALWRHALPPEHPAVAAEIDYERLVGPSMTGAEISAAALNAAFLARAEDTRIGMDHLERAVRLELDKRGEQMRSWQ